MHLKEVTVKVVNPYAHRGQGRSLRSPILCILTSLTTMESYVVGHGSVLKLLEIRVGSPPLRIGTPDNGVTMHALIYFTGQRGRATHVNSRSKGMQFGN